MDKWNELEEFILNLWDTTQPAYEDLERLDKLGVLWEDPESWDNTIPHKAEQVILFKILEKMNDLEGK